MRTKEIIKKKNQRKQIKQREEGIFVDLFETPFLMQ